MLYLFSICLSLFFFPFFLYFFFLVFPGNGKERKKLFFRLQESKMGPLAFKITTVILKTKQSFFFLRFTLSQKKTFQEKSFSRRKAFFFLLFLFVFNHFFFLGIFSSLLKSLRKQFSHNLVRIVKTVYRSLLF
uniref:Uncharacterized protein n=1 Tax=Chaetophora lobata TaxID=1249516 RepID=A0A7U1AQ17_9CHLO|nr:hypothetical protein [Chaetophora lobata]